MKKTNLMPPIQQSIRHLSTIGNVATEGRFFTEPCNMHSVLAADRYEEYAATVAT
jgi:hypothetical protein